MKKILIVVDMQNDFVDGALGTKEAQNILDNVVKKIEEWDGDIFATYDTHFEDYMETSEGKNLPVSHCIEGTDGWMLNPRVQAALNNKDEYTEIQKITFGSIDLPLILAEEYDMDDVEIELVGLCTDICVVSNALILKATYPETPIRVDASCCAGVTPDSHKAALTTMKMCQINVIGD